MSSTISRLAMIVAAVLTSSATMQAQSASARRSAPPATGKQEVVDGRAKGLSLGVYTMGAAGISVSAPALDGSFETKFGPGVGVTAGYGFNRTFSAFASLDLAKQGLGTDVDGAGTFGLSHFEVGARANLPLGSATTIPYVNASVGRRALGSTVTIEEFDESFKMSFTGKTFGIGGGVQRFFSPTLALDGGVDLAFGKLDHLEMFGEKVSVPTDGSTSVRFRLGVTWRPGARRTT
jgi:hypothetical protein